MNTSNTASGGGGNLLSYLIAQLEKKAIPFHVLAPDRAGLKKPESWMRCVPTK